MIDTHFHLYDEAFDPDRDQVVERARQSGVTQCILPAIEKANVQAQWDCAAHYAPFCRIAVGLHPTSVLKDTFMAELDLVESQLRQGAVARSGTGATTTHIVTASAPASADLWKIPVAIGEIGLDAYWSRDCFEQQITVFEQQLQWASFYNLPVIIHARACFPELMDCLQRMRSLNLRGTLHAWSGSLELFTQANRYGDFKMGVGGVLTYKNSKLVEVVRQTPLSEIILETDAPWLTPVPWRGQRNESAYVRLVAEKIAQIKEIPLEEVDRQTTQNALSLFSL